MPKRLTSAFASFDIERFIAEVKKRPTIYNVLSPEYMDKELKEGYWMEIGEVMHTSWSELPHEEKKKCVAEMYKKWKAIRDNYVKELRNEKKRGLGIPKVKKKEYVYKRLLTFLGPLAESASTETFLGHPNFKRARQKKLMKKLVSGEDITDEEELSENKEISDSMKIAEIKSFESKYSKQTNLSHRNTIEEFKKQDVIEKEAEETDASDMFGDRAFLLSFLPIMKKLPLQANIEFRFKVSEAMKDAVSSNSFCKVSTVSDCDDFNMSEFIIRKNENKNKYDNTIVIQTTCEPLETVEYETADNDKSDDF